MNYQSRKTGADRDDKTVDHLEAFGGPRYGHQPNIKQEKLMI